MDSHSVFFESFGANYSGGQSIIARKICGFLSRKGHTIYHLNKWLQGGPCKTTRCFDEDMGDNFEMLGVYRHPSFYDILPYYMKTYKPDDFITYSDVWDQHDVGTLRDRTRVNTRWIANLCFDTENIVDIWNPIVLEPDVPWVATDFVRKRLAEMDIFKHVKYWYNPIGTDVDVFKPVTPNKKAELREKYAIPRGQREQPLLVCVAMNQIRKKLDRLVAMLAKLRDGGLIANLWFVTEPNSKMGWDLNIIARNYGVTGQIFYPDNLSGQGISKWVYGPELAEYYQMADAFVLLTGGGGFEIPIIEAMSCGLPGVSTCWTTPPEFYGTETGDRITEECGLLVQNGEIDHHSQGGFWRLANIDEAAAKTARLLQNPDLAREMGMRARQRVVDRYNWETILPKWDELIRSDTCYDNRNLMQTKGTRVP